MMRAGAGLVLGRASSPGPAEPLGGIDVNHRRTQQLREPPQLHGLPFEWLGIPGGLFVEPLSLFGRDPNGPHWIDAAVLSLGRLDWGQPSAHRFIRQTG